MSEQSRLLNSSSELQKVQLYDNSSVQNIIVLNQKCLYLSLSNMRVSLETVYLIKCNARSRL